MIVFFNLTSIYCMCSVCEITSFIHSFIPGILGVMQKYTLYGAGAVRATCNHTGRRHLNKKEKKKAV